VRTTGFLVFTRAATRAPCGDEASSGSAVGGVGGRMGGSGRRRGRGSSRGLFQRRYTSTRHNTRGRQTPMLGKTRECERWVELSTEAVPAKQTQTIT
jgi:hypothetical protein